jgi:hypothetical protein
MWKLRSIGHRSIGNQNTEKLGGAKKIVFLFMAVTGGNFGHDISLRMDAI